MINGNKCSRIPLNECKTEALNKLSRFENYGSSDPSQKSNPHFDHGPVWPRYFGKEGGGIVCQTNHPSDNMREPDNYDY